jgi:Tfp pilus assembly protein PilV
VAKYRKYKELSMKYKNIKFKTSFSLEFTKKDSGGFTIIETLVAITVLMIAVAGPLVVASKGLNSALYARDQVTASFLGQESMEVIKNQRDNNKEGDKNWLDQILLPSNCIDGSPTCDADAISSDMFKSGLSSVGSPISFNDSTGYNHDSSGISTKFKRYYYLTLPNNVNPCLIDSTECTVHVKVTWNEGTIPYDVDLGSELLDVVR